MSDDHNPQANNPENNQENSLTTFLKKHPVLVPTGAVILYVLFGVGLGMYLDWYINPAKADVPSTAKKDVVQAVAVVLAGLAGIIGVYFTWQNLKHNQRVLRATQENTADTLRITERGQITERFTRAVDQLGATDDQGNKRQELRLGGIYALERVAVESADEYHWPIMRVLTAYLRQNALFKKHTLAEQDADIQAILTVIGQRALYYGAGEDKHLHLYGTDFSGYDLREAHLEGAYLWGTHFESAVLYGVHLNGASLSGAHFEGAFLQGADLREADLRGAHLEGAYLDYADLTGAHLGGAHLNRANLQGTDLREVNNLEKLEHANGDRTTMLPEGMQVPEWWGNLPGSGPLEPQEYSIKVCKVALHFSVGENWHSQVHLPNSLVVTPSGITHTGSMLSFNNIRWVCDPQQPKEEYAIEKAAKSLDGTVSWFLKHPHLQIENLDETEIGGAPGKQLDAIVPHEPDKLPLSSSGRPQVSLFPSSPRQPPFALVEGNRNRIIILNVGGSTLTLIVESRAREFEKFILRVQEEILATVRWTP